MKIHGLSMDLENLFWKKIIHSTLIETCQYIFNTLGKFWERDELKCLEE